MPPAPGHQHDDAHDDAADDDAQGDDYDCYGDGDDAADDDDA